MNLLCLLRRRAMACEMKAEATGANTRLAILNADMEIHVCFRKSIEMQARPHPTTNHKKQLPVRVSVSGRLLDLEGQSKGVQVKISMRNSKRNWRMAISKSSIKLIQPLGGGYDFGNTREIMTSSPTTTTARIPQNTKPPFPGTSFSRHEDFLS